VFHKNHELAGCCSVLHALQLTGSTGDYGPQCRDRLRRATARGAVTALNAHGVHDVCVLTTRGVAAVASPIHSIRIRQIDHDPDDPGLSHVIADRGRLPLAAFLARSDIVVNCTLQDPEAPLTYLRTDDLAAFRPGSLLVDVSCDEELGFSWARPTTFDEPMFDVGDRIHYYASTTARRTSGTPRPGRTARRSSVPPAGAGGTRGVAGDVNLSRAIEIRDGRVVNPQILAFQGREEAYPHPVG